MIAIVTYVIFVGLNLIMILLLL